MYGFQFVHLDNGVPNRMYCIHPRPKLSIFGLCLFHKNSMVGIDPIGVRVHFRDPERKLGDLHVRALCPSQRGGRAGAQDPPSHRQQGSLAVFERASSLKEQFHHTKRIIPLGGLNDLNSTF